MPLIRISMRRGRPASEPAAIIDGVYKALRETFEVPKTISSRWSTSTTPVNSSSTPTILASTAVPGW